MSKKTKEDYARGFIQQAEQCLREGDFRQAFLLLGRVERFQPGLSGISELLAISEVCYAASCRCICGFQAPRPKHPDWYRIFKVEETADVMTIRKRYRQLALLLHPDKNKYVRAEEAFKLVSEAYACLSDRNARKYYDMERLRSYCARCYSSFSRSPEEDENEALKTDQERLYILRQKARARVSSLTHDMQLLRRRSRWTDLENAREKLQKRNMLFQESGIFQPSYERRFCPDTDIMSILRARKTVQRQRHDGYSLDGLINKLKKDGIRNREETSKLFDNMGTYDFDEAVQSSDVNDRVFSKRVSSPAAEAFPARKLFKEDDGDHAQSSGQLSDGADLLRRQSFPLSTEYTTLSSERMFSTNTEEYPVETPPPFHKPSGTNNVGDESTGIRTEYVDSPSFCCRSSRNSVLKDQKQKSEELLRTLEKLRQEAKSVAATLDKLKSRVDTTSAELVTEVLVRS